MSIIFDEVFSAKQGENRAECTEAKIFDYATGAGDLVSRTSDIMINSLIFLKYGRCASLDAMLTLAPSTPYFSYLAT